jgi:hypothetical protein
MIIKEVELGQTEGSKRQAIHGNLGRQVILHDGHEEWCHGFLLKEDGSQVYQMQIANGKGQRELHYHDLNKLLVLIQTDYDDYKLPEKYSVDDAVKIAELSARLGVDMHWLKREGLQPAVKTELEALLRELVPYRPVFEPVINAYIKRDKDFSSYANIFSFKIPEK